MRILVIVHNQVNDGPYFKVLEMCLALLYFKNEITLLCTSKQSRLKLRVVESNGVLVVESPDLLWGKLRQGVDIWNILQRLIYVARKNYDIVHAIDCRPVVILPALFLKFFKKTKFILSWWDWFGKGGTAVERSGHIYARTFGKVETFFEEYFRKYADGATVISTTLKERLISLKYPEDRIELHRIGCNIEQFPKIEKLIAREKLSLTNFPKILCFIGNLFPNDKNLLIDALKIVKKKVSSMPLTILVGDHKINKKIKVDLNVMLTGILPTLHDVYLYLYASDFGLIPMGTNIANRARWPSKTADYWSVGLPVISTPISDYPELFPKYDLGFLSKSDSAEDYSDAIYSAIISSREIYQTKQYAIANFVKNELDWTVLGQRLYNLYKKIL